MIILDTPVQTTSQGLPRRDLYVLPLISLLTVLLMTGAAELASRLLWPEKSDDTCLYHSPVLGDRHRPNCVMTMKNIEGPFVQYQMNACGYRGTASCGPKPPGTLRVAVMGTSVAFGLHVPYDEFFATRAAPQLSRLWHHPVEVENLGDLGPDWSDNTIVLDEMRRLNPDAIFMVVVPFDLNRTDVLHAFRKHEQVSKPPAEKLLNWTNVRLALRESRFFYMSQHFLLRDENFFLRAFQDYADPYDVSRLPLPPLVQQRFDRMNFLVGRLADYARAAGIPCYLLALPNRVEAALISRHEQLPGMDAYAFSDRMKAIARQHGLGYVDLVPDLEQTPDAEKLYYPVDGHPNGQAHDLMARALVAYFKQRGSLPGHG